jgi:signal peptidase I
VTQTERWEKRHCTAYEETLDGHVYTAIDEPDSHRHSFDEVKVPPGHVFVVGDNRDNSHDSRFFGYLPLELVNGRALFVWWSLGPDGVRWDRINREIR